MGQTQLNYIELSTSDYTEGYNELEHAAIFLAFLHVLIDLSASTLHIVSLGYRVALSRKLCFRDFSVLSYKIIIPIIEKMIYL